MELEKSNAKKVPVYLWMDKYEKALEVSVKSRDSNLINLVIHKMMKMIGISLEESEI